MEHVPLIKNIPHKVSERPQCFYSTVNVMVNSVEKKKQLISMALFINTLCDVDGPQERHSPMLPH